MLRNKLSHLALLDEQLERLQKSANEISVIIGHDLESVEGAIVSLLTKRAADVCPADGGKHSWFPQKDNYLIYSCRKCGARG